MRVGDGRIAARGFRHGCRRGRHVIAARAEQRGDGKQANEREWTECQTRHECLHESDRGDASARRRTRLMGVRDAEKIISNYYVRVSREKRDVLFRYRD